MGGGGGGGGVDSNHLAISRTEVWVSFFQIWGGGGGGGLTLQPLPPKSTMQ